MNQPNKDLLSINLNKLEEECRNQPKLMWDWAEELVRARKWTKLAKRKMKLRAGILDRLARKDPEELLGVEKATEKAIEYFIAKDKEYQECEDEFWQAEADEDTLDLFVKTIADRREELSNLCKLHGQTYWSKPDTSIGMDDRDRIISMQRVSKVTNKDSKRRKKDDGD